jgi:hypothetical protein
LAEVDSGGPHSLKGGFIFDSFCHGANVERLSEADDGVHDVAVGLVGRQIPDELDVDLELGDRELLR